MVYGNSKVEQYNRWSYIFTFLFSSCIIRRWFERTLAYEEVLCQVLIYEFEYFL